MRFELGIYDFGKHINSPLNYGVDEFEKKSENINLLINIEKINYIFMNEFEELKRRPISRDAQAITCRDMVVCFDVDRCFLSNNRR